MPDTTRAPIVGQIANQVRFILDDKGRIVGNRNPLTDADEPLGPLGWALARGATKAQAEQLPTT